MQPNKSNSNTGAEVEMKEARVARNPLFCKVCGSAKRKLTTGASDELVCPKGCE